MPPRRSTRNRTSTSKTASAAVVPNGGTPKTRGRKRTGKQPAKANPNGRGRIASVPTVSKSTAPRRPRPQVISLDVTYSESEEDSDIETIEPPITEVPKSLKKASPPKRKKAETKKISQWPSVHLKEGRCTLQSESESEDDVKTIQGPLSTEDDNVFGCDDSDSENDDLYSVNFKAKRQKAFQMVKDELEVELEEEKFPESKEESSSTPKMERPRRVKKSTNKDTASLEPADEEGLSTSAADSSLNLSIDNMDVSQVVLRGSTGRIRRSAKTKSALASLKAFSQRFQDDIQVCDKSVNDLSMDDDVMLAEEDNWNIPIRVRWGTQYVRYKINMGHKFIPLYQEIADKHSVSVSQVVLSFNDKVISPEATPREIGFSIGDFIEGGILSEHGHKATVNSKPESSLDEDILNLKVQTSNRKTFHVLQVNKYDKMIVLMEKYAAVRDQPLACFKFKFDGEKLDPNDTPSSLDLEGDECIDVFEC